ncbi:MAG: hypothetical protein SPL69_02130 [Succinivibrionaceae bacterium]|nr:hypothetical protein [Succinivibrionaceae bacterium]
MAESTEDDGLPLDRTLSRTLSLKCPKCGRPLKTRLGSYCCDCGFRPGHWICGVEITEEELGRILEGNGSILRFTSSKKKPFWAKLKVSEDKMKLDFEFIHDLKFDTGMLKRKKGGHGRRKTGSHHEA